MSFPSFSLYAALEKGLETEIQAQCCVRNKRQNVVRNTMAYERRLNSDLLAL